LICYDYKPSSKLFVQGAQINYHNKSKNILEIFDIENEVSLKYQTIFLLNSFEGFGQLNYNNKFYLCGGSEKRVGATYFFMFDPSCNNNNLQSLINCFHDHKYPAMIGYKNEYIVAVGGIDSCKCELYSISKNRWRNLPEIPENRYGCSLIADEKLEFLYLFGGINQDIYYGSILRLNLKTLILWDSVIVKENYNLLQKSHFAIFKSDRNSFLLVGGSKRGNEYTDEIIEFDLTSKVAKQSKLSLNKPSKFILNNHMEMENQFYFFDSESYIHIFNKSSNTFKINNYIDNLPTELDNLPAPN